MKKFLIKVSKVLLECLIKISFFIAYILIKNKKTMRKNQTVILDVCKRAKGSYGDEALIAGAITSVKELGGDVVVCEYSENVGRKINIKGVNYETIKYLGFPIKLIAILKQSKKLIILGADVIDGAYGNTIVIWDFLIAKYAHLLGVSVAVSSFSYSNRASNKAKKCFMELAGKVNYNCRDRYSADRIQRDIQIKVNCYPDVAFCMKKKSSEFTDMYITEMKRSGKKIIGININDLPFSPIDKQKLYKVWGSVADFLIEKGYYIVFIPHDIRQPSSDLDTIKKTISMMTAKMTDYSVVEKVDSSAETKEIISKLDYLVTGRMHAGVAALSTGVPCAILDYNNKALGLLHWFQMGEENLITKKVCLDNIVLKDFLFELLSNQEKTRILVESHVESVIEMAKRQRCTRNE